MKAWQTTAALMIAVASVVGCDKKDETKTPTVPAVKTEGAADKMGNMMSGAKEAVKEGAADATKAVKDGAAATETKAAEVKDAAAAKAMEVKDATSAAATDAKAAIVETAQKYYDQAKGYLASNNLTSASDMISKLDGIKSQLPAEWQTKVDELKAMYDKAKAGVGNLMPKMGQ